MFKAKVTVMLRAGVLDPQGAAIGRALKAKACEEDGLSFPGIASVRVGKVIELTLDGKDPQSVEEKVRVLADRILANPVMEEYTVSVEPLPRTEA